ncbi:hypothetical protein H4I95_09957 [Botrytis cinerea]
MEKRRKSSVPGIDRLLVVTSGVILLHNDFPSWSEFTLFGVDNTQVYGVDGDDGDDGVDSVDSLDSADSLDSLHTLLCTWHPPYTEQV